MIRRTPRRGISILEVLAALAIFMLSFVAINELINLSLRQAALVQHQEMAALLCQTKLAEVAAGALPLTSQESTVEEDPNWTWSVQCEQHGQLTGLWNVRVSVSRMTADGHRVECVLNQMVLDPSLRGSTMDSTTISGMESTTTGSSTTTGGSP